MGCQKEIAKKITSKEADYMLALKGNQGTLNEDVEVFFTEQKACKFKDTAVSRHQTLAKDHGRIETRTYTSVDAIDWLKERHDWTGLKSIVMVESVREIAGGKTEQETRFYISSMAADAERQGDAIRSHWGVESHHWVMDMVFRDDECGIRRHNAPANFAIIKHIASNCARKPASTPCASNAASPPETTTTSPASSRGAGTCGHAIPLVSRLDRVVPFRMECVAFDVEALHLGRFDPDAFFVGPLVEGAFDF